MVGETSRCVAGKGFAQPAIWPLHLLCHRSQTFADLIMNKLEFKGEWHELKGKLRQKFAELTDNDLDYAEGQEEELLGHLQKKLGKSQQEIAALINNP
jgi:uncharacterized protein YjbJ (UPF0337 family)